MTNSTRFSPMRMRSEQAGFTLMELLIGIAVLAILTTLALPAFTQFIANNRLASEANEMVASFQFARSEAIKRGVQVQVCPSADGTSCGGSGWSNGWIAFADPDNTGQPTSDDDLLRVWTSPGADFQFTPAAPADGTVGFQPSGFATGAEQTFDLLYPGCTTDNARRILVERTGRVASEVRDCPS